ncbi:MAG: hypothetical protein FJ303_07975 [Planctomycetes bacterium]|nr:hypothetical protein [Planctomycetota bacterium]
MDWLFIAVALVVAIPLSLFLIAFIVGRFLPERYDACVIVELDRTPEEVWNALLDTQQNPMTGSMCRRQEKLADVDGRPSWLEDMGSSTVVVTTTVSEPTGRLCRRLADQVVPMTAEVSIVIEETQKGCRVTVHSVTVIRDGTWHVPIFRVMMTITGGGRSHLKSFWQSLAQNAGASASFG